MIWRCLNSIIYDFDETDGDGNNNILYLLDNLTIIDNTIEFEEGHYFKANN